MTSSGSVRAGVLLSVALIVAVPVAVDLAGAQSQVAITDVNVSPSNPGVGEITTFTVTLRNAQGASETFEVEDLFIRTVSGTAGRLATAEDPGSIPPGETLQVPLTTTFDSSGVKDLRVVVRGQDESGDSRTFHNPVTVVVADRGAQLSVDVADPVDGASTVVNVTVSNGGTDPIRQLDLRLDGDGVDVENPRRLLARLEAGADRTFSFDVTFAGSGETAVDATLQYAATSGQSRTVRQSESVDVDPLREDVEVSARVADPGGANPPVSVEVTNFGNARLEDVQVRVSDGDRAVARRSVDPVEAGGSREVAVNLSGDVDGELDVTAAYETGGRAGEASTSVRYASQPGRIELTGVDFSRDGGVTTISGSASNVGLSDVNSVVVRVLPAEGVEPVAPNREYFVGTVPASDFVSFDLTARIEGSVESVPVEVTYLSDGVERSRAASVPYEPAETGEEQAEEGGGLGAFGSILLLLAVLVVAGAGVLWWRRREDGGSGSRDDGGE